MHTKWFRTSLLILGLVSSFSIWATPWVSIPSTPDASDKVVIKGGDIEPFTTATVRITWPDGTNVDQVGAVEADGTFIVEFLPTMIGSHTATVLDQKGEKIGGGIFVYMQ
jgi:hypothetical protein